MSVKIDIKDLCLSYDGGRTNALDNINMDIQKGTVTAFIGPSGCGKSTLLRCFNRMNDFISGVKIVGSIKVDDCDIYSEGVDPIDLRRRVGMVFQKPNPFPLSIWENVAYGPKIHGVRKRNELDEIVEQSLVSAALWDEVKDRLDKPALSLSGGQQQRLCIARAVAVQPEIILMDEPTSALDPLSTIKIEMLASELKKNYTVVIVTHNMQQASRVSEYTAFFLGGKLIEYRPTQQLFKNPLENETRDYIAFEKIT